jgi:hypothetical protein
MPTGDPKLSSIIATMPPHDLPSSLWTRQHIQANEAFDRYQLALIKPKLIAIPTLSSSSSSSLPSSTLIPTPTASASVAATASLSSSKSSISIGMGPILDNIDWDAVIKATAPKPSPHWKSNTNTTTDNDANNPNDNAYDEDIIIVDDIDELLDD